MTKRKKAYKLEIIFCNLSYIIGNQTEKAKKSRKRKAQDRKDGQKAFPKRKKSAKY